MFFDSRMSNEVAFVGPPAGHPLLSEEEKKQDATESRCCEDFCDELFCSGNCNMSGCNGEGALILFLFVAAFALLYLLIYSLACIFGLKPCMCESLACGCYKPIYLKGLEDRKARQRKKCSCMKNGTRTHEPPATMIPLCDCKCYICAPDHVAPPQPSMDTDDIQSIKTTPNNELALEISPAESSTSAFPNSAYIPPSWPVSNHPHGTAAIPPPSEPPSYSSGTVTKDAPPPYSPPAYSPPGVRVAPPPPPNRVPSFDYGATAPEM